MNECNPFLVNGPRCFRVVSQIHMASLHAVLYCLSSLQDVCRRQLWLYSLETQELELSWWKCGEHSVWMYRSTPFLQRFSSLLKYIKPVYKTHLCQKMLNFAAKWLILLVAHADCLLLSIKKFSSFRVFIIMFWCSRDRHWWPQCSGHRTGSWTLSLWDDE